MSKKKDFKQKSHITLSLLFLVLSMLCLAYASVPLYKVFCKVTGYGGTVKKIKSLTLTQGIESKEIKIYFNADVIPNLPWIFKPELNYTNIKTGEQKLVFYYAENLSDHSMNGMAVYNVTPHKAGKYFNKIACFCFAEQTLPSKKKVVMPVSFFIDPEIAVDPETSDVEEITLSYTFFELKE